MILPIWLAVVSSWFVVFIFALFYLYKKQIELKEKYSNLVKSHNMLCDALNETQKVMKQMIENYSHPEVIEVHWPDCSTECTD